LRECDPPQTTKQGEQNRHPLMRRTSAKTMAYLLNQLRATPRSRISTRTAGPQTDRVTKFRPWEIKAGA